MEPNDWTPPPMALPPNTPWTPKRRRGVATGAALIGTGVVAGAIVGATVLSGAATTSPSTTPDSSSSQQEGTFHGHGPGRAGADLGLTGTVTAVGSSSVTIKTSTATTTYQVDGNSDIDKNGEAKLSDLKVGDAVRFKVTGSNVIDKLHAGDEALDRPQGPPPGQGGSGG